MTAMAWMRLSPLLLCVAALVLLATGAVGKPVRVPAAHFPVIEGVLGPSYSRL